MRLSRVSLIAASVSLAFASSVRGQSIDSDLSPKADRSEAQQKRDEADCHRWATLHTGFDPKQSAPEPPRDTGAELNRMPGQDRRAFGDLARRDDLRRRELDTRKKRQAQEAADFENRRASYERSVETCIEGRNHSLKSSQEAGAPTVPGSTRDHSR